MEKVFRTSNRSSAEQSRLKRPKRGGPQKQRSKPAQMCRQALQINPRSAPCLGWHSSTACHQKSLIPAKRAQGQNGQNGLELSCHGRNLFLKRPKLQSCAVLCTIGRSQTIPAPCVIAVDLTVLFVRSYDPFEATFLRGVHVLIEALEVPREFNGTMSKRSCRCPREPMWPRTRAIPCL